MTMAQNTIKLPQTTCSTTEELTSTCMVGEQKGVSCMSAHFPVTLEGLQVAHSESGRSFAPVGLNFRAGRGWRSGKLRDIF